MGVRASVGRRGVGGRGGAASSILLVVACVGATFGVVTAAPALGAGPPPKPESATAESARALAAVAGPTAHLATEQGGGPVTFIGEAPGHFIPVDGGGTTPGTAARAFVDQYGAAFGEPAPARDLRQFDTSEMAAGGQSVGYQQLEQDVPIVAAELRVQVASGGKVRSAAGEMSTGASVDTTPSVLPAAAASTAAQAVAADAGVDVASLDTSDPELWVYDPVLIGNTGPRRLVWQVDVSGNSAQVHKRALVDAHTSEVALQIERAPEAKNRQVCDNNNVVADYTCPSGTAPLVRSEGQGPTGNSDVDAAYNGAGATYDFYSSRFGRDSIDGAGMTLRSTVRHCEPFPESCPYANAFWDGGDANTGHMVYGQGFAAADDVVGHELTHGVTQFESNLVYANQSGAINESLSDVFGEFIDQVDGLGTDTVAVKWLMGEDVPGFGAIRDMEDPPSFGDPDRMGSSLFATGTADSGGVHTNSGVNNKAAFLMTDGGTFNGQTITGLGLTKAARIYYEAQTNILTSGSNYAALGNALNQACNNVVGVNGVTVADCTQVAKVVTATEMLGVPPPANDNFANAQLITGTTGTTTGSTSGATRETGEPCHGGAGCGSLTGTASIWYKFTAGGNGTATITTCNSSFDTILGVYTGGAVNALTAIVRNDDASPSCSNSGLNSRVQFTATQGTTYFVAVDGFSTNKGAVTLNWTLPAAGPTGVSGTVTETGTGTPVSGTFVAVLKTSDFAIAGGTAADASGNFSVQVPAGSYFLYLIDPAATHATGFFGPPTTVTVTNGSMTSTAPTMASVVGTIAGTVTEDGTGTPIAGAWAIPMSASTGASEPAAVANGSGQFSRPGLRSGNHLMAVVDPTGAHTPEFFANSSTFGGASPITVNPGATSTANDALATRTPPATSATLTGTVTESGTNVALANVMVVALKASDMGFAVAGMTNGSGQYSLNLTNGVAYKLEFIDSTGLHEGEWFNNQPLSNVNAAASVTAPAVSNNASLDRRNGSITGTITDDVSNAAVQGAWVFAIGSSGIVGGAVSAANGTYTLGGLPAGSYVVTFVDPAGGRTQEYFNNSSTYAGATPIAVTGGGTATANAALHHP